MSKTKEQMAEEYADSLWKMFEKLADETNKKWPEDFPFCRDSIPRIFEAGWEAKKRRDLEVVEDTAISDAGWSPQELKVNILEAIERDGEDEPCSP